MEIRQPVVLALALDERIGEIVDVAQKVTRALGSQLVPVHAISRLPRVPRTERRRSPPGGSASTSGSASPRRRACPSRSP
jgi:hypothetical protein